MSRFPKNLSTIFEQSKFREYCLNPLGIKINTPYKAKPQRVEKFVNFNIMLHRTEKPLEKDTFIIKFFNTQENLSKPEIKQYLTKLYGLDVKKVNTVNMMGKIARNHQGKIALRKKDYKKAYVQVDGEVDEGYQKLQK